MNTSKLSEIHGYVENHVLHSSKNTDDFLKKMKSVDEFFKNFDQIGKKLCDSIEQINVEEFYIDDNKVFYFSIFGYTLKLFKS